VPDPEEMSREELIVVVRRQAGQITAMAGQLSELMETNEALAGKLARLEHLLSRNSGNSSSPPSKDDDPGKPAPPEKSKRDKGGPQRARGKQPGAPGTNLAWTENPDECRDRFPQGRCECGDDLGSAWDLGIVEGYQQHEIPQMAVKVTQYDQHQVQCGCGKLHTADRPAGARSGPLGYGPNLAAFAVYLMVVQFIPAHRVVALLESLTGTAPSVGFVHSMLSRAAGLLTETHQRIRALITLAHAVSCDETPCGSVPSSHQRGRRRPNDTCWSPPPSSTPTTCSVTDPWTPSQHSSSKT
jgi:transposase